MIDILVYLFQSYESYSAQPAVEDLTHQLKAAGFEADEIESALEWLGSIEQASSPEILPCVDDSAIRVFTARESSHLGPDGCGLLHFLERCGRLPPAMRELVVDRALAFGSQPLSLERLKVIVLAVLWSRDQEPDLLLVEELLADSGRQPH